MRLSREQMETFAHVSFYSFIRVLNNASYCAQICQSLSQMNHRWIWITNHWYFSRSLRNRNERMSPDLWKRNHLTWFHCGNCITQRDNNCLNNHYHKKFRNEISLLSQLFLLDSKGIIKIESKWRLMSNLTCLIYSFIRDLHIDSYCAQICQDTNACNQKSKNLTMN